MIPTLSHIYAYQLGFPKPGSFGKTAFSGFEKSNQFSGSVFGSHIIVFTANRRGGGLQTATLLKELLLTLSHCSKRAFIMPPCLPGIG